MTVRSGDGTHDPRVAEVRQVVAEVERCQRAEDVDGFLDLFAPDAVWTTATGKRLLGRESIRAFTAQVLPGAMQGLRGTTYEVENIEFLRPDVAAVLVRQTYRRDDGTPAPEGEGAPMYVMVHEGHWRLSACQNTPVAR